MNYKDCSNFAEKSKGHYVLILYLKVEKSIRVGRLGTFKFPAGYYCYVGSALGPGGLGARVGRHVRGSRSRRWHVEYLREKAIPIQVWLVRTEIKEECQVAKCVARLEGGSIPVAKFGSSDCACCSHLFYFSFLPCFEKFAAGLRAGHWPMAIAEKLSLAKET